MENAKNFFESIKEFIWDIIGYLIPGSYLIILLSSCINSNFFISPSLGSKTLDLSPYIFVIISYVLGYAAYGFGCLKESILGSYSYTKQIEKTISSKQSFIHSKKLISEKLLMKVITDDLNKLSVRDFRNIAMSFIPESDQKIYTFTFRADLANHTANISLTIGCFGLLFSAFKFLPIKLFLTNEPHVLLYISLVLGYLFLRQTRNRFYAISINLPFSIFTANAIK